MAQTEPHAPSSNALFRHRHTIMTDGRRNFRPPVMACALLCAVLGAGLLAGCSSAYYRTAADRQVYGILGDKELALHGSTNALHIDTPYSARDPKEIPAPEIIADRAQAGQQVVSLEDALRLAVQLNRQYQFQKETLYLTALTLTGDRREFARQPVALFNTALVRDRDKSVDGNAGGQLSVSQLLKNGGTVSASLVSDVLRYFSLTSDPQRSILNTLSLKFTQPLLRGAGVEVVAENLKQSERDVIYALRSFSQYQKSFAVDVVTTYFRLLQRKDAVRNSYENYRNLIKARERAEALAKDRLPAFQADQARQDELRAKSTYIAAVEQYRTELDQFKVTLGVPIGTAIHLEDAALKTLISTGLIPLHLTDDSGYELAVQRRPDLLNEIDQFEDSKRKIIVAANALQPGLTFIADASLAAGATDYANFDLHRFRSSAGLGLDLPVDRLLQRNLYRTATIKFERQLRTLAAALDTARDRVRQNRRTLAQVRQNHVIQNNALDLANKRVESAELLLQAGRAQIRDQLEAQTALVLAQNAVTQVVVDYHAARWKLLLDAGLLQIDGDRWWLQPQSPPAGDGAPPSPPANAVPRDIVTPDILFGQ